MLGVKTNWFEMMKVWLELNRLQMSVLFGCGESERQCAWWTCCAGILHGRRVVGAFSCSCDCLGSCLTSQRQTVEVGLIYFRDTVGMRIFRYRRVC